MKVKDLFLAEFPVELNFIYSTKIDFQIFQLKLIHWKYNKT